MWSSKVKRPSLVWAFFSLAVIMVCSTILPAAPPGWSITQLTDNDFGDYNLKISGSNVVWTEWDSVNYVSLLFFYNGSTTTKLSDKAGEDNFELSGSNVLWLEYDEVSGIYTLFFYNNSTITKLSDSIDIYDFEISSSNAVWQEYDSVNDTTPLFFYNGSTITKLTNNGYDVKISGSNAVWQEYDAVNDTTPLFFYNSSTITKLTNNGYYSKISGSNACWLQYDDVNEGISLFFYNGATITKLAVNINMDNDEESFCISDSNVAWAEYDEDNYTNHLFFYNGSTTTKLTDNVDVYSVKISGSNVGWSEWDDDGGIYSLFLYNGSNTTKLGNITDGDNYELSGSNVVWEVYDDINEVSPLFFYNGSTTITLAFDTYEPKISGSNVIWTEWDKDNYVSMLFLYDGSIVSKLADVPDDASYCISGSNIVWQEYDGHDTELFFATQIIGIQVTLWPIDAVLEGAQWNIDGGEWQDSGAEVTGLSAGLYTVNYRTIAGWNAPASESVTINRGAITSIDRNYTPQPGNLQITLGPAQAVSEGAQWKVDGGAWQNSRATIMGLSAGLHTVNYKSLTGWHTPGSESVTINRGMTTSISRNYIEFPGGIKIALGPAGAVTAGAQWNVDGGAWRDSGAEVTGLSPGVHKVNYKSVSGWIAHISELITVSRGMTTSISRSYTPQARGLVITKCNITAGKGSNDNDDIINFSGTTGITAAELGGSEEITIKIGDIYSEVIAVSSFINKKGKFTYTRKIATHSKGAIASLLIDTNKHTFSLKARNIDLSGLHCPFDIEFATDNYGNYRGVSSIYENTANGKKFVPVKLMSGVNDYLQVQSVKIKKGRVSDTLTIKGGIAYEVLPTSINDVVLKLDSQTFTLPAKNFKPSGKSGYKYVCKNIEITGGIASATFDFGKCTFTITVKKAKINKTTGEVGLILAIGSFSEQVNFNLDTGQAI